MSKTVLVTGATGYIGGRLVPRLLDAGYRVRAMARNPSSLALHPWRDAVEVVGGDALDPSSLQRAAEGVDLAFYLIHSMDGSGAFGERDAAAAANFRDAADAAGLERVVYLGGLGDADDELSSHLASRHEVGQILASGSTPVTELRAAVIIGAGSVSFEMLRYLTEVLPVMTTPRWVRTRCQPVAIGDVLDALVASLDPGDADNRVVEIGGPEVLTYEEMMQEYAEVAGLMRRYIVPVPVLSPRLSSLWVGLVTPLPVGVARPLIDSLRNEVVVRPERAIDPAPRTGYRQAVALALSSTGEGDVTTRWSDSAGVAGALPTDPSWAGGTVFSDRKTVASSASPAALYGAFARIGGDHGYYTMNALWRIRGRLDQLVGGIGLRRGRRHPTDIRPGEALDFWRVADVVPGRRLLLRAEMKLPGLATLEFTAVPTDGGSTLVQEAMFRPRGLLGRVYWYGLWPAHVLIFGRMARRIARAAERQPLAAP
jgi:uncharacterized protein YbjT (DUF2867 family)